MISHCVFLRRIVVRRLSKPGTRCFATSIEGTSAGLTDSDIVGKVGIGGFVSVVAVELLVVFVPLMIAAGDLCSFFPLSIKVYVPFEGTPANVADRTSLIAEGVSTVAAVLLVSEEGNGSGVL
jgi:hypothetical protein